MARRYEFNVWYFDPELTVWVEIPVRSLKVEWLPSAGSTMTVQPMTPMAAPVGLAWRAQVVTHGEGKKVSKWLINIGISRKASGGRRLGERGQTIEIHSALAAFADKAPTVRVAHTKTTLEEEVQFVAETVADPDNEYSALPDINIPRIDYVPSASYWDVIAPYLNPLEPLVLLQSDGVTKTLEIIPTIFGLDGTIFTYLISPAAIADLALSHDQYDIINQTKLVIQRRKGDANNGTPSGVMERRQPRTANGDGTSTERWQRYIELDESGGEEEAEGVTAEKQEIVVGVGYHHWSSQGLPIRKDVSETEYEENYTLPLRQTRTISGRVRLPLVGEEYRENAFSEVTTNTWIPWDVDDDHPYTWTMTKQRTERRGYYLVDEKVPIDVATANNTVDADTTSSQTYSTGLHTVIETVYEAIAGDDVVMQKTTTYNTLYSPPRVIGDPEVTFIGRSSVTLQARPRVWHIKGNLDLGPRREGTFDGTRFGYELSVRIIEAIHFRAAAGRYTGTVTLKRPDLERPALGKILMIEDIEDPCLPDRSLIVGVSLEASGITPDGRGELKIEQKLQIRNLP